MTARRRKPEPVKLLPSVIRIRRGRRRGKTRPYRWFRVTLEAPRACDREMHVWSIVFRKVAWSGRRLGPGRPAAQTRGERRVSDLVLEDRE